MGKIDLYRTATKQHTDYVHNHWVLHCDKSHNFSSKQRLLATVIMSLMCYWAALTWLMPYIIWPRETWSKLVQIMTFRLSGSFAWSFYIWLMQERSNNDARKGVAYPRNHPTNKRPVGLYGFSSYLQPQSNFTNWMLIFFFSCDQAALWMVQSVCLSVCLSVKVIGQRSRSQRS